MVPIVQLGMPGGLELLVMLLIMLLFVAIPVAVLVVILRYLGNRPDAERVRDLEREVAELRGRLDERGAGASGAHGEPGDADE